MEEELTVVIEYLNEMMEVVSWAMKRAALGVAIIAVICYSIIYIVGKKEELPKAWARAIIGLASIILATTLLRLWVYILEIIPVFEPIGF